MSGRAPFRLNSSGVLLALVSAAFAGEAGAAAARVDFTTPGVIVANRNGQTRALARGAELDSGDTVRTDAAGRAQLRFTDGSYVSLQPNTDFAISDYKFEGKDDDRGFFGLVRGAMRTVTGAVGKVNRNSYRITTPTATVGIRGTGGVIQVQNDGSTLVIGTSGIWSLTNPAGSIDIPAGVSGLAPAEPNTPPKETTTQPQTGTAPVVPQQYGYAQGNQVNPDGTAAIFPSVLVSGSGFAVALSFAGGTSPGVPQLVSGSGATATFNASGQLTDVTVGGETYKTSGSQVDFGTDGILAWGRWTGNITANGTSQIYAANQGLHYVIGTPTAVMPASGTTGTYSLIGATQPTYANPGATGPGTFSGSLNVIFGATTTVGVSYTIVMPDGFTYVVNNQTGGGTGSAFSITSSSLSTFAGSTTPTGAANCTGGCSSLVQGFFAGASAQRAGIGYHLTDGNLNKNIIGTAAFTKN